MSSGSTKDSWNMLASLDNPVFVCMLPPPLPPPPPLQPILVEEPSGQECLQLLEGLAPHYETFHGVNLPHATLATAVAAAQR